MPPSIGEWPARDGDTSDHLFSYNDITAVTDIMGKSLSNGSLVHSYRVQQPLFKPVAHGGRRRFSGLRMAHGGTPRPRPLIAAEVGAAAAAAAAADSADSDGAVAAAGFDSLLVFLF